MVSMGEGSFREGGWEVMVNMGEGGNGRFWEEPRGRGFNFEMIENYNFTKCERGYGVRGPPTKFSKNSSKNNRLKKFV